MIDTTTKFIELLENVHVIPGNTNIGVIINHKEDKEEIFLIDSGTTELDGDYILDVLKAYFSQIQKDYYIKAIINTHGHADHCGGNNLIQEETGCEVWAPETESALMNIPEVQSALLCAGHPIKELQTLYYKFVPFTINRTLKENEVINLSDGATLTFISLPGHYFNPFGIIYTAKDGKKVIFSGDALFEREQIAKYWIPYTYSPKMFLSSLEKLSSLNDLLWCIPGHGNFISKNFQETIELNQIAFLETRKSILRIIDEGPIKTEDIIRKVAELNELHMGLSQFFLIGSTIKAFLADLHNQGKIKINVTNNELFWEKN